MTPQLKLQDGKPIIEGKFEFSFGISVYNPVNYVPAIPITFKWCPEISMEAQLAIKENQYAELIAEKLKQDFIEHIKNLKPII